MPLHYQFRRLPLGLSPTAPTQTLPLKSFLNDLNFKYFDCPFGLFCGQKTLTLRFIKMSGTLYYKFRAKMDNNRLITK